MQRVHNIHNNDIIIILCNYFSCNYVIMKAITLLNHVNVKMKIHLNTPIWAGSSYRQYSIETTCSNDPRSTEVIKLLTPSDLRSLRDIESSVKDLPHSAFNLYQKRITRITKRHDDVNNDKKGHLRSLRGWMHRNDDSFES